MLPSHPGERDPGTCHSAPASEEAVTIILYRHQHLAAVALPPEPFLKRRNDPTRNGLLGPEKTTSSEILPWFCSVFPRRLVHLLHTLSDSAWGGGQDCRGCEVVDARTWHGT